MKLIASIIFCLVAYYSAAQSKTANFFLIDKRVKKIQAFHVDSLAHKLTSSYKSELEKVRAIFKWITENIAYDTKAYHDSTGIYPGLWDPSVSTIDSVVRREYNDKIVQKVLNERKAVCDGYARLFKTLCEFTKIKSEIITGYIRWHSDPIGAITKRGHAWNAVFINNTWKLIDATWASGFCDKEVTVFTKRYNDFFFLPDPIAFFNDHYPDDSRWSLLPNTPSIFQFYNYPFYYPAFYKFKILSVNPTTGYIEVNKVNKIATIELETNDSRKSLYVYESPLITDSTFSETNDQLNYKTEGKKIVYAYKIRSDKAEKIDVIYNDQLILSYGLKIR